jgi:hypothetical protein
VADENRSDRVVGLAFLAPLALCLPCLLLPLGLALSAVGFAAISSWFMGNALTLGLAAGAALLLAVGAAVAYARQARATACDVRDASVRPPSRPAGVAELDRR